MVKYFEIGQISNTHGLKGEMKVRSFSKDEKKFEKLKSILIDNEKELEEYNIETVRYQTDIVLLKLKGIDTIEDAEKLKGYYIKVPRESVDKKDNEYFIADLIGMEIYENQKLVGKLDDIFSTGSNDVYVIKRENKKDLLLPAIESVIKNIDMQAGRIEVEIPRGLDDEI